MIFFFRQFFGIFPGHLEITRNLLQKKTIYQKFGGGMAPLAPLATPLVGPYIHITFRVTFVIFVVIVAYDVAIVLFQICMNSPVHRIKQKISYQSDSVQQSVTQMA